MKIKQLPCDPGITGWNAILPAASAAQELDSKQTADWLVIGGGFAGLAAARRLAQLHSDARIVVLDATRIGQGPAGRNTGFMIDLPHDLASEDYGGALEKDLAQTRANRAAIDFASEMAVEFGFDAETFVKSGKINAAAGDKGHQHNLDFSQHLSNMGEANELYDAARMQEITGSSYYQSGLYTPGAAMIQPVKLVRGVAEGLKSNRVSIYENSPVVELSKNGDWFAKTPKGSITAPKVIMATNGHANSFGYFPGRLLHVFLYGSMTRALTPDECARLGGQDRWALTPADPMGSTVRRISGTGGDRIIVRNRFTCDPSLKIPEARVEKMGRSHDKSFLARFPMLQGVEMEYRWGGRLCLSWNSVPALGEVEEGMFTACCQNGLGVAKGTLHGMLMAEMASGVQSELLDQVLAQDAPTRLPPKPLTFIGANAAMRWGEYKAGHEL
ncbi:Gamma-glutamylputrescine oxidoreductase [Roseovarius albus]|uniref:Gamma-glutamylputrescine oxidoreductase n=1 Tax=Roseovarius albus TaxID=1247867 RepID=A0A1X6Z3F7_9RHOB|nr:FAD-binding oxidoreductase [Roseovarius albus]SLN39366.1 Gamma-glutamylputrescine oxidoreductase [Roseovarius albus]